jgi:hypothetical protein
MEKAFYEGMIEYRNQMRIKQKRGQAAMIFFSDSYLCRGFQALI